MQYVSQQITIEKTCKINSQNIPSDGFCYKFGFCTNACQYRSICNIERTKLLLHCIVITDEDRTFYPVDYVNDISLIPDEVRIESTIVNSCSNRECNKTLFYSRIFYDTYITYALAQNKSFEIFCCNDCKINREKELVDMNYKCLKVKKNS